MTKLFSREINEALRLLLQQEKNLLVFGEDIEDPYGGAFGITRGLSTNYPERVLNCPISEAGLLGMCFGISSEGLPVMLEFMFGDFSMLVMDQLHNNMAKVIGISDLQTRLIIRTPMGGYRGYGPTHSQNLSRFLLGSDNVYVVTSSNYVSPHAVFEKSFTLGKPCFYIEDKMTYLQTSEVETDETLGFYRIERLGHPFQDVFLKNQINEDNDSVLVVCVGSTLRLGLEAARELLLENETTIDIYQLNSLWPINYRDLKQVSRDRRGIVIVEEAWSVYGVSSEIQCVVSDLEDSMSSRVIRRLGAKTTMIPNGIAQELEILPSSQDIVNLVKKIVDLNDS